MLSDGAKPEKHKSINKLAVQMSAIVFFFSIRMVSVNNQEILRKSRELFF